MTSTPRNYDIFCDIFCAVVDNYGDAGVCWRLARQLAMDHGWRVRLWIDDPQPLHRLAPDHASGSVDVRPWREPWQAVDPADIVIEAFACEPPAEYVAAMARREPKPIWFNLEYLSAEAWIASCHGQPSPHPRLPLMKHFFFPGFDAATGGLLREADYDARRAAFDEAAFRAEFGLPPRQADELTISMFAYPHAPLPDLLPALVRSTRPISLLLPGAAAGAPHTGALRQFALPFLPQNRYDEILWACDLNFVRGEDSFVRAQWAAKPLVWHIYPQDGDAHMVKLDAFLDRHPAGSLLRPFWHAWNGRDHLDWPAFAASLPAQAVAAKTWQRTLSGLPDLAAALVQFAGERLK
jgi:uncharacterized repeat protein (TIGR03837 family)